MTTRISFVIGSLAIGGAETQLVRLVNGLDRDRFKPSIVCLTGGGELEEQLAKDVPVIKAALPASRGGMTRVRAAVLAARILTTLVRGLRAQRPDVVHGYLPAAYVLGGVTAWMLRVPVIIAGRRGLSTSGDFRTARWRALARAANRVIDVHICNSNAVRDWTVRNEGISATKTRVIHNGVDIPPTTREVSLPAGWSDGGPTAAMVANLIHYKGHREVVQAVRRVVATHPSFRLVLIGDGRERNSITGLIDELGITANVILAGKVPNAADLLPVFDFTVLGSSEEGFPNALMESMAAGVPVVSTAVGGVMELVEDGVEGLLVPYGDITAMSRAMAWMIDHPEERRRMGEAGRRRIAADFSTRQMVEQTEAVYEELLGRRPAVTASRGAGGTA